MTAAGTVPPDPALRPVAATTSTAAATTVATTVATTAIAATVTTTPRVGTTAGAVTVNVSIEAPTARGVIEVRKPQPGPDRAAEWLRSAAAEQLAGRTVALDSTTGELLAVPDTDNERRLWFERGALVIYLDPPESDPTARPAADPRDERYKVRSQQRNTELQREGRPEPGAGAESEMGREAGN